MLQEKWLIDMLHTKLHEMDFFFEQISIVGGNIPFCCSKVSDQYPLKTDISPEKLCLEDDSCPFEMVPLKRTFRSTSGWFWGSRIARNDMTRRNSRSLGKSSASDVFQQFGCLNTPKLIYGT